MEAATGDEFLVEPIRYLKGVGPRRADVLEEAGIRSVRDLLQYYPRRYLDRSTVTRIRDVGRAEGSVTIVGKVLVAGSPPARGRQRRFEMVVGDDSGRIKCVWFRGAVWISKLFKVGDSVALHGKPNTYRGSVNLTHPDFDKLDEDGPSLDTGRIIALYPGTAAFQRVGLTSRVFRKVIWGLFKEHGLRLRDPFPETLRKDHDLIDGRVALRAIHFPKSQQELGQSRRRLIFEEFFFIQLLLARLRSRRAEEKGHVFGPRGGLSARLESEVLPFMLTGDQAQAIREVVADTRTGRPMNRLLQGDVGSGKTVVAVAAMLHAVDHGFQAVFMAPTEILAEQHYRSLMQFLDPLGIQVRLLVGGQRKALRREILAEIANGQVQIVVGTHALIQDGVEFPRLGLAVVDEQHRFGVMQRARLTDKGDAVHTLLMTATPIPRSLAMTVYGDLDVTVIREKPAGRKPVITRLCFERDRSAVYEDIRAELKAGRQCYVVYPLVEESEKLDLKDAESGYQKLREVFPQYEVAVVHGRMAGSEKDEIMQRFKAGLTHVLVSTTVIEVGVDVPNASMMVIEHAERFGLSQLHQLRGRVGRGADQAWCILMADFKRSAEGEERMEAMVETDDGFKISEIDLKMRGAGDFFGTRQSGLPDLRIADVTRDQEILAEAREAASTIVARDPDLKEAEARALGAHYRRFFQDEQGAMAQVG
ncbi:MAG: ATP-dependent DNA helicase RecG [Rhodothermales bacterium]|nr:ATP-dependent DNA helicase RecG [Rhodothermales bacterium]MBO6778975.1 ATP-dependent DNA helicase RecG [Rhodothermales bacterium]